MRQGAHICLAKLWLKWKVRSWSRTTEYPAGNLRGRGGSSCRFIADPAKKNFLWAMQHRCAIQSDVIHTYNPPAPPKERSSCRCTLPQYSVRKQRRRSTVTVVLPLLRYHWPLEVTSLDNTLITKRRTLVTQNIDAIHFFSGKYV